MRIVPTSVTGQELTRPSGARPRAPAGCGAQLARCGSNGSSSWRTSSPPAIVRSRFAAPRRSRRPRRRGPLWSRRGQPTRRDPGLAPTAPSRRPRSLGRGAPRVAVARRSVGRVRASGGARREPHPPRHLRGRSRRRAAPRSHRRGDHEPRPAATAAPRPTTSQPRHDDQLSPITVHDGASELTSLESATERWISTFSKVQPQLVDVIPPDSWPHSNHRAVDDPSEAPPGADHAELRALDVGVALLAHLNNRHDAVVIVSSPRWPSTPSHWWATARRLVRQLSCPVLVVPAVEQLGHAATVELRR